MFQTDLKFKEKSLFNAIKKYFYDFKYSKGVCVTVKKPFFCLFPMASTASTINFKVDINLLSYLEGLAI